MDNAKIKIKQQMMQSRAGFVTRKKGHTQIDCRSRIRQNKPLTWKNKEIKSNFNAKTIHALMDFDSMDKAKEWQEKIEAESKLKEKPSSSTDFL